QWKKAVESFKKSAELSPGCAEVYAGLASGMGMLALNGIISPQESVPQWRDATSRALSMDSGNSKAHVNRANLSFYVERAWAQSEAEYLSSIKSNQSDASAYSSY